MGTGDGRILGTTKILNHGPDSRRFNIVLLSDGYRESEMGRWHGDAGSFAEFLFGLQPFAHQQGGVNIFRVDVASVDSGADDPVEACEGTGATPRTFFDATYCGFAGIRRFVTGDHALVRTVLSAQVPDWDVGLVVVNSSFPPGGAASGPTGFFARAPGWREMAVHEMGHAGFGLADEYDFLAGCGRDGTAGDTGRDRYTGPEIELPNITTATTRDTLKWRDLVAPGTQIPTTINADCARCDRQDNPVPEGTVGSFEGASTFHCGLFRPQWTCLMQAGGHPFCAVCQRRILETMGLWARWGPVGDPERGDTVPRLSVVWPAARGGERVDLFVVGHDRGIYTSGHDTPAAAWDAWHPVGDPAAGATVPAGSVVTAVARLRDRLDVFVVGHDHGIHTSGKSGPGGGGAWEAWHPIGNPGAGDVVPHRSWVWPVARGDRVDVFVVGNDGGIYTSGQDAPGAVWETWHPVGDTAAGHTVPTNSIVAAVARPNDRLDLFVVGHDEGIYTSGKSGAGGSGAWETWHPIGNPDAGDTVPHLSAVFPVARGNRADVFVVGHDGGIYTSGQDTPGVAGWEAWHPVGDPGAGDVVPLESVVWPVAVAGDRLEVYVVGTDGGIYTSGKAAPGGAGAWEHWCPVGDPKEGENVPRHSTVSAVSTGLDRCQLFVVGHNEGIFTNRHPAT